MANGDKETVTLKLPTGEAVDFVVPGGMSDAEVKTYVLSKRPDLFQGAPQQAPQTPGANQITGISAQPKPGLTDVLKSAADPAGAVSSAIKNWALQGQNLTVQGAAEHPIHAAIGRAAGFLVGGNQGIGTQQGGMLTNPITGAIAGVGPGGEAADALSQGLPSAMKAQAGGAFQKVMAATKDIPIDVGPVQDAAFRAEQMAKAGGQLPKVIKDFIKESTDSSKGPMTYERARDFYTNATGRLAPDEAQKITPVMFKQLGEFTSSLKQALTDAAAKGGEADTFRGAMQQYSQAASRQQMIDRLHELATKGVKIGLGGAAVGAAGGLGYDLYKILHGDNKGGAK